jgi:hypothetical protein
VLSCAYRGAFVLSCCALCVCCKNTKRGSERKLSCVCIELLCVLTVVVRFVLRVVVSCCAFCVERRVVARFVLCV